MGLFSLIKSIKSEYKKISRFMSMNYEDLCSLSDDELQEALSTRMIGAERHKDVSECLSSFTGAQKVYYIVNYFDMEVQNGGLCQYFVNSSRETAPYILESLSTIGANSYYSLLLNFIKKNDISLHDLDSFIIEDVEEFEEQTERYPFDEFDETYYELYEKEPLEDILFQYVKQHLEDF